MESENDKQGDGRILKTIEISDWDETSNNETRRQGKRKNRQLGERKKYSMRERKMKEVVLTEDGINCNVKCDEINTSTRDEQQEEQDKNQLQSLGNVNCISHSPINNTPSFLGTTAVDSAPSNIVGALNYNMPGALNQYIPVNSIMYYPYMSSGGLVYTTIPAYQMF